jgi:hypothetical protein
MGFIVAFTVSAKVAERTTTNSDLSKVGTFILMARTENKNYLDGEISKYWKTHF